MSDLSASEFGCPERDNCPEKRNCDWIWLVLILLVVCKCCGGRRGCFNICDLFKGNNCCEMLLLAMIISCCCCK